LRITYKTQLLDNIKEVVDRHVQDAEVFCDIFSGTASVARFFKQWYTVYSNDLLYFSYCLQKGTIELDKKPVFKKLCSEISISDPISYFNSLSTENMEAFPKEKRFFHNNYAPAVSIMYNEVFI
jgi:adenine-specific DNA-methyltransferase